MVLEQYHHIKRMTEELKKIISSLEYEDIDCSKLRAALNKLKEGMDELPENEVFQKEYDENFL